MTLMPSPKPILTILLIASVFVVKAQNYSEQAKLYFGKLIDSKQVVELCSKSFPTLEDCKLVFKGANAFTYFGYIEEIKSKMQEELQKPIEKYVEVRVESFSSEDVFANKGNYAGGMTGVSDKIQSSVLFYKIEFLKELGAEAGVAYKYWVNINGRWVFFPKPWAPFN